MRPCISEATTLPRTFAEDVADFADAGCHAMEVWLTKLEKHLETHSAEQTRQLLTERQMTLAAASYQGGLLLSQGEQRKVHFDHYRRRLDLCQQFGIQTLLVVADFTPSPYPLPPAGGEGRMRGVTGTDLERAVVSMRQAAQWAAGFDVRLALEFRGSNTFCSSLDTAVALVAQCGEANVGVNFDVFHYYTGPSKFDDLALLTPANLAFVQLADLVGVPRELAADADRVLPGDGDFHLEPILRHFRKIGYDGWVSLELMNPTLWQTPARQVAELGMRALERLIV